MERAIERALRRVGAWFMGLARRIKERRLRRLGYQEPTEDQRARGCFGIDALERRG